MRLLRLIGLSVFRVCLWMSPIYAQTITDSSTAFFEGDEYAYTVMPPHGYKLLIDEARADGYSFAFVPEDEEYNFAGVVVLGTYLTVGDAHNGKFSLSDFVDDDTAQMRTYFGDELNLHVVEGVTNFRGDTLPTVFLNDPTDFIPTVMVSYYLNHRELFIFELVISDYFPRFKAEDIYLECLLGFKVRPKGDAEDLTLNKE